MGLVVALPALAVLFVLNKRIKGKPKGKQAKAAVAIGTLVIAFAVGCGIAYSFLGRWGASALSWSAGLLAGFAGSGVEHAVPLALTVLAILWATGDVLYDRKADKGAQVAVIVLPTLLALVVGGQLGTSGGNAVEAFFAQAHTLVSQLGGA